MLNKSNLPNQIIFSTPDYQSNTIIVFKDNLNNQLEEIGKVFIINSNYDEPINYVSTNKLGEEISSTSDFAEIEKQYEKYAEELYKEIEYQRMQLVAEKLCSRQKYIRKIRNTKADNIEAYNIIK